jgi:hypothetical protein
MGPSGQQLCLLQRHQLGVPYDLPKVTPAPKGVLCRLHDSRPSILRLLHNCIHFCLGGDVVSPCEFRRIWPTGRGSIVCCSRVRGYRSQCTITNIFDITVRQTRHTDGIPAPRGLEKVYRRGGAICLIGEWECQSAAATATGYSIADMQSE